MSRSTSTFVIDGVAGNDPEAKHLDSAKFKTKANELQVEYIQRKLQEGYKYLKAAENGDLVLMIGNMRVGKSTGGNYLLGHPMIEVEDGLAVATADTATFGIGHAATAETMYAKPARHKDFSYLFTDCPGFLGNRSSENRVIESISTEMVIRKARQVKGILIFISMNHLSGGCDVAQLSDLMKTLVALFKDPVEMINYSTFIITKKESEVSESKARKQMISAMQKLKSHCETQKEELRETNTTSAEKLSYEDYSIIASYFSEVLKRMDQVVFLNPLDGGASRKIILDKINGIKPRKGFVRAITSTATEMLRSVTGQESSGDEVRPITIEDFNFSSYDENRVKFNKAMYDLAYVGSERINMISECDKVLRNAILDRNNSETRVEPLRTVLKNLSDSSGNFDPEEKEQSTKNWERLILKNNNAIALKTARSENEPCLLLMSKDTLRLDDVPNLQIVLIKNENNKIHAHWRSPYGYSSKEISLLKDEVELLPFPQHPEGIGLIKQGNYLKLVAKITKECGFSYETLPMLISNLTQALREIDTEKPMPFGKIPPLSEKVSWYKLLGWISKDFQFDTQDPTVPLTITKQQQNGEWYNENDRQKQGYYKITYKSNYYTKAEAKVEATIKTKDEAGNKKLIIHYKNQIKLLTNELLQLQKELGELATSNEALQLDIETAKTGFLSTKAERNKKAFEKQQEISRHQMIIRDSDKLIQQTKARGNQLLKDFMAECNKYEVLVDIARALEFPSTLIQYFVGDYQQFLKVIKQYSLAFEVAKDSKEEIVVLERYHSENRKDIANNLPRDPLTKEPIQSPVVTRRGTLFDEHSLLEQFLGDEEQPFSFTHADGQVETIPYNSWIKVPDFEKYLEQQRNAKSMESMTGTRFFSQKIEEMSEALIIERQRQLLQEQEHMRKILDRNTAELERIERYLAKKNQGSSTASVSSTSTTTAVFRKG